MKQKRLSFYQLLLKTFSPLGCTFLQGGYSTPSHLYIPQQPREKQPVPPGYFCNASFAHLSSSFRPMFWTGAQPTELSIKRALLFCLNSRGKYGVQSSVSYYDQSVANWKGQENLPPSGSRTTDKDQKAWRGLTDISCLELQMQGLVQPGFKQKGEEI